MPTRPRTLSLLSLLLLLMMMLAVIGATTAPATSPVSPFSPIITPHLHNAHKVTASVFSGAQPDGELGFKTLAALGVKTIISVDGARPDIEAARKYGLRYVHLPIGYDTISPDEGTAIAKAIAVLPGPFYIHCHHGKHRSAAAVAVACVYTGQLKAKQAEAVLQTFGTGQNYTGLWNAARDARPLEMDFIRRLDVEFPETAKVPPLAEAMVSIDQRLENLRSSQMAGWQSPSDHPDITPAHEALQLHEYLIELSRAQSHEARTPDYRQMMLDAQHVAASLYEVLAAEPPRASDADAALTRLTRSCTACHAKYRD